MIQVILFLLILFSQIQVAALGIFTPQEEETTQNEEAVQPQTSEYVEQEELLVTFSYNHTNIVTIINQLASYKGYNIIFPQGPALTVTVTLSLQNPISIDAAWDMLISVLDVAGYTIVPHGNNSFALVKNNKDIARETYQTFIGTDLAKLPDSAEMIRYVYYLSSIKIGGDKTGENDLLTLFKVMMPAEAIFAVDTNSNALVLVGKAKDIQGFMHIVEQLDQVTFHERMEIVKLRYTTAATVAQLVNENFIKQDAARYRVDTKNQPESAYINPFTKIIPENKTNSVILLGTAQSIERLKEFIENTLDVDISKESKDAKSVIHVYELQYRDAASLAEVLKKIVEASRQGGSEQSRGRAGQGGVERSFEEVIVMADKPKNAEEMKYYGGNKLIVACSNKDWEQIEKLIEEIDTPDAHIFIEVLVADLLLGDTRSLSAQFRVPARFNLPGTMQAQASHLNTVSNSKVTPVTAPAIIGNTDFVDGAFVNPTSINTDLLRNINASNTPPSLASYIAPGSTLVSFNDTDGTTWGLLNVLSQFQHSKTLSHPHVTCANNQKIVITNGQQRLLDGQSSAGTGAPVRANDFVDAVLKLEITPRIIGDFVYLTIKISINDFINQTDPRDGTQSVREFEASAITPSGGILACGGLSKVNNAKVSSEVPILGRIPIIGPLFFSKHNNAINENSLAIFISPTIVQPQFHQGLHEHTQDYIDLAKKYGQRDGMFVALKDPITRWFFKAGANVKEEIDEFVEEHVPAQDLVSLDTLTQEESAKKSPDQKQEIHEEKQEKIPENNAAQQQEDNTQETVDLKTLLKNQENPFRKAEAVLEPQVP